jgi:hypothetical protein
MKSKIEYFKTLGLERKLLNYKFRALKFNRPNISNSRKNISYKVYYSE